MPIPNYGDEALLEGYGMTEWPRTLPEEPVSMETFCRECFVVGL